MEIIKLFFFVAAMLVIVQCTPDLKASDEAVEDIALNEDEKELNDFIDVEDKDEDEDEIEEIEDPSYYRRKCRHVRKCRSSKKCSHVRVPVKYGGSKGSYKKPRYQLRCKPVRRCRRVRVCRKVQQTKYAYGK